MKNHEVLQKYKPTSFKQALVLLNLGEYLKK